MKEIKTIIVDDDPVCIQEIEDLLIAYPTLRVMSTITDPSIVMQELRLHQVDILFLDIEMPRTNGLDLAAEIRKWNTDVKIIFITAYNKYAVQAIKKSAFDYLLKPVDKEEFADTMQRYLNEEPSDEEFLNRLKIKYHLTRREAEITNMIRAGKTSEQIAASLMISKFTIDKHRQNILKKAECANFIELLRW